LKHGSVAQNHTRKCPRAPDGTLLPHRCRGTWKYVLEYGRDSNGRRRQTSKGGFPTKAAAQTALQGVVRVFMSDVSVHSLTVGEYLDSWLTSKNALKPKTTAVYRDAIELYLRPHLGGVSLLELRAHHLDRMYAAITVGRRGRPLSPSTVRRIHAVLRSALGTAVKRRLIPYNPAEHIELAPENPKRPQPWTTAQCLTFLRETEGDRLATLYQLLLVTGMRRGEAVGLRWQDVDLDGGQLKVVQQITEVRGRAVVGTPKTKRGTRVIPIDPGTVERLRRHREAQSRERQAAGGAWVSSGLVFTRADGSPLRPEYVTRHFQRLARQLGLPEIRLHDLRHTNASLALTAGVELKVVSERLGHSQTAITADLYTHVSQGVARAAADRIAGLLNEPSDAVPSSFLPHPAATPQAGGSDASS
jgi:integrase